MKRIRIHTNPFKDRQREMEYRNQTEQANDLAGIECCDRLLDVLVPLVKDLPVCSTQKEMDNIIAKLMHNKKVFTQKMYTSQLTSSSVVSDVLHAFVDRYPDCKSMFSKLPSQEDCLKLASQSSEHPEKADFFRNLHANLEALDSALYNQFVRGHPLHTPPVQLMAPTSAMTITLASQTSVPPSQSEASVSLSQTIAKPSVARRIPSPDHTTSDMSPAPNIVHTLHPPQRPQDVQRPQEPLQHPQEALQPKPASQERRVVTAWADRVCRTAKAMLPLKVIFRRPTDAYDFRYDGLLVNVRLVDNHLEFEFSGGETHPAVSFADFRALIIKRQYEVRYGSRDHYVDSSTTLNLLNVLQNKEWKRFLKVFPRDVTEFVTEAACANWVKFWERSSSQAQQAD